MNSEVPVYAIALLIDESPNREWLVYAHSPVCDRSDVIIRIPISDSETYDITAEVKQKGSFYLVREENNEVIDVLEDPRLVSISGIPEFTVMGPGQKKQLKATGKDQYGNTYPVNPVWLARRGKVDSAGLYTSPENCGLYTITVRKGNVKGTAIVNVSEILAHWSFDEGSGFVVRDEAGCPDNDAYLTDSLFCDDSISGTAIEFKNSDREVGNYDYLSAYTNNFSQQPISISLWVHPISSTGLIIGYFDDNGYKGWRLDIDNQPSVVFSLVGGRGTSLSNVRTTNTPILDAWHHIVVTDDKTNLKIYIDGVLKKTAASADAVYANEMQISMGITRPNTQYPGLPYTGIIDDAYIYSKALSQDEVSELYNSYPER